MQTVGICDFTCRTRFLNSYKTTIGRVFVLKTCHGPCRCRGGRQLSTEKRDGLTVSTTRLSRIIYRPLAGSRRIVATFNKRVSRTKAGGKNEQSLTIAVSVKRASTNGPLGRPGRSKRSRRNSLIRISSVLWYRHKKYVFPLETYQTYMRACACIEQIPYYAISFLFLFRVTWGLPLASWLEKYLNIVCLQGGETNDFQTLRSVSSSASCAIFVRIMVGETRV